MLRVKHLNLVPALQIDLYQSWQQQILKGNASFDQHDLANAMVSYRTAIRLADQLLVEHDEFHMAVVAMIVSHHNLADVMLVQSCNDLTTDEFLSAHKKLLTLQTQYIADMEKLEAIMWGLRRTYTALLYHLKDSKRSKIVEVPQMPVFYAGDAQLAH